jgi:heme exporter protein A
VADSSLTGTKLTIARGERILLRDLDLVVEPGEALVLTGPNGAGKTSLLRALAGLLRPMAGTIAMGTLDPAADGEAYGAQLHFVGHRDAVKSQLTVRENLSFWVRLCGQTPDALDQALLRFGLGTLGGLPASFLSQGQRRRLALCRLAALNRPLWLLDEPAASLDEEARGRLGTLIQEHRGRGGIVVMASHGELSIEGARAVALGPGMGRTPC